MAYYCTKCNKVYSFFVEANSCCPNVKEIPDVVNKFITSLSRCKNMPNFEFKCLDCDFEMNAIVKLEAGRTISENVTFSFVLDIPLKVVELYDKKWGLKGLVRWAKAAYIIKAEDLMKQYKEKI